MAKNKNKYLFVQRKIKWIQRKSILKANKEKKLKFSFIGNRGILLHLSREIIYTTTTLSKIQKFYKKKIYTPYWNC